VRRSKTPPYTGRPGHVLVHEQDERAMRTHRHQVDHAFADAVDVVQAGTVQAERHTHHQCFVHRIERR
jgi:hypothetical protein